MKKVKLKVNLRDETAKQKAMTAVSGGLKGVNSISMDMKAQELTVIGDIDPVDVVNKLRELCKAEITSVVPVEKPESSSKKKEESKKDDVAGLVSAYQAYNPYKSSSSKK